MHLSSRIKKLSPSVTLAITARARELKKLGQDVIALGIGEPDFNTPEHIIAAAKNAMDEGKTKYTPSGGIPELKEAIRKKFKYENQLIYRDDQITVTTGAKQALYNAFQVLLNPGDEVIVLAPYWVSYIEQIKLAGGKPVIISCEESHEFKVQPSQLKSAITPKTKVFLLNSPSNPAGVIYTKSELKELGNICVDSNIVVISDEIYEHLIYEGIHHSSIANTGEEIFRRTIIINGVSKTYSMTGWRIGFAAGPSDIIAAMTNLAGHSTSSATSISQYAAVAALNGPPDYIRHMRETFKQRRDYVIDRINQIPLLECKKPLGAFYVYVNIKKAIEAGSYVNSDDWARELLERELVAVIPGTAFGSEYYIRISYATSIDHLAIALDRMERFILSPAQG